MWWRFRKLFKRNSKNKIKHVYVNIDIKKDQDKSEEISLPLNTKKNLSFDDYIIKN